MEVCLRCGNEWTPRKPNPKKCPSCQNPNWNKPRTRRRRIAVDLPRESTSISPVELRSLVPGSNPGSGVAGNEPAMKPRNEGMTTMMSDRIKQARERAEKLLEGLL